MPEKAKSPKAPSGSDRITMSRGQASACRRPVPAPWMAGRRSRGEDLDMAPLPFGAVPDDDLRGRGDPRPGLRTLGADGMQPGTGRVSQGRSPGRPQSPPPGLRRRRARPRAEGRHRPDSVRPRRRTSSRAAGRGGRGGPWGPRSSSGSGSGSPGWPPTGAIVRRDYLSALAVFRRPDNLCRVSDETRRPSMTWETIATPPDAAPPEADDDPCAIHSGASPLPGA